VLTLVSVRVSEDLRFTSHSSGRDLETSSFVDGVDLLGVGRRVIDDHTSTVREKESLNSGSDDLWKKKTRRWISAIRLGAKRLRRETYSSREGSESCDSSITGVSGKALTSINNRASDSTTQITRVVQSDRVDGESPDDDCISSSDDERRR